MPHFCPGKREVWYGEPCGPLHRAKFHVYRGNVSPLRSEKPIFGPLSKRKWQSGMAALRAGLPLITDIMHMHTIVCAFVPVSEPVVLLLL